MIGCRYAALHGLGAACLATLSKAPLTLLVVPAPASLLQVKSQDTGVIEYDDLASHLIENKHRPAILNLNIGTTVKGAVDDLDKVRRCLGSPTSMHLRKPRCLH